MQADLNTVRNDPDEMDLQYAGMHGQAYGNGYYSGLSREFMERTLPGQFIKLYNLFGIDEELHIVKVHRNGENTARFALEVFLNNIDEDDDEFIQMYVDDPNFKFFVPDDLTHDYIVVCTEDERDGAIKLHNKLIVQWKAKHLRKRYRNLFRLIGRVALWFTLWYTEISLRPQHSGMMRAREEFHACANLLY